MTPIIAHYRQLGRGIVTYNYSMTHYFYIFNKRQINEFWSRFDETWNN